MCRGCPGFDLKPSRHVKFLDAGTLVEIHCLIRKPTLSTDADFTCFNNSYFSTSEGETLGSFQRIFVRLTTPSGTLALAAGVSFSF